MAVKLRKDRCTGRPERCPLFPGPGRYTFFFPVIIKVGGLLTLQARRKGQTRQVSRSVFEKAQFPL